MLMSILAFLFVWANKTPNQSFSEAAADIAGTITKSFGNNEPTEIAQGEKKPDPEVTKTGGTVKVQKPPPQELAKVNPPRQKRKIVTSGGKPKFESKTPAVRVPRKPKNIVSTPRNKPKDTHASRVVPGRKPPPPAKVLSAGSKRADKPAPRLPKARVIKPRPKLIAQLNKTVLDKNKIKKLRAKEKFELNGAAKILNSIPSNPR